MAESSIGWSTSATLNTATDVYLSLTTGESRHRGSIEMRAASFVLMCLALCHGCASQSTPGPEGSTGDAAPRPSSTPGDGGGNPSAGSTIMRITVGSSVFTATLANNEAGAAFKAMLPATFNMTDVNANEKAYDLPRTLPTSARNPGTIHAGDVMLYGSTTLVLFYKKFPTSYSYTRLGKVDDPSGLAAALGAGNVTVTFAL